MVGLGSAGLQEALSCMSATTGMQGMSDAVQTVNVCTAAAAYDITPLLQPASWGMQQQQQTRQGRCDHSVAVA